jgi:outer membrane protein
LSFRSLPVMPLSLSLLLSILSLPVGAQEASQPDQKPGPEKSGQEQSGPEKSGQRAPGMIDKLLQERPDIPTDKRGGRVVELSLQDCLRLGSEENIDLRVDRLLEMISRQDIVAAEGLYDVEFFLNGEWTRTESPPRSQFQPSSVSKVYGGQVGLRKRFLSGATAELSYGPRYTDQQVNSTFSFPNTFFGGDLNFSITQPLLRGAWWDYNEAPIEQAKHEYVARRYDFEANRQTVLDTIATAYYDLAFARENWVVKYYSLELARERLRNTESRIRLGGLAPRDRIADEADVAVKQEDLILAETTILDAEDALRRLILGFTAEDDWDLIFVPTVDLSKGDPKIELPSWRDAAMVARKHRPDVLALMRRVQSAKLSLQQADSDLLPQLDLIAGYSTAAQRDDFGSFNSDIFESEFPSYRVGLEFSIPLGNRIARSRYEAARLDVRRLMTSLSILHIDIIRQVREAIRRLERLEKSIAAAEESVRLARNNLEAEQIKLRLDSSTQFEVQERANELSDAASRLLRSRLDYRDAWFTLLSVQGKLDEFSRLPGLDEDGPGAGSKAGGESSEPGTGDGR